MQKTLLDEHKEAFAPPGSVDWQSSFSIVSAIRILPDQHFPTHLTFYFFR
jgi:hypothetical protein